MVRQNPKKSLGIERCNRASIQGLILATVDKEAGQIKTLVDSNITDRREREYAEINIEIDPGYDKFIQSADPAIQARMMAVNQGDLVLVTGVVKNNGRNVRILVLKVLKAAPQPASAGAAEKVTSISTVGEVLSSVSSTGADTDSDVSEDAA
jgi:hypothetical protein